MKRPETRRQLRHCQQDSRSYPKTWRDWHDEYPWLFPLPTELANDHGWIGEVFRRIPEELLRDADRCPDPWRELSTNRFLMVGGHSELFNACASVLPAAIQLSHKVYQRGNLIEQVKQATTNKLEVLNRKLFPGMWRAGAGLLRHAAAKKGPDMLKEFEEREGQMLKMIAKKHGKVAAAIRPDEPTGEPLRKKYPILYLMLTCWLRSGPRGDPGFMFYSDLALADLFSFFDWQGFSVAVDDLNSEQIEQMRGRVGLRKAIEKIPLITGARINPNSGIIELNTNDAKIAKSEWPKIPVQLRCQIKLSGRVLYGGVNSLILHPFCRHVTWRFLKRLRHEEA